LNIAKSATPSIFIKCTTEALQKTFSSETPTFQGLIRSGETTILGKSAEDPAGCIKQFVNDDLTIFIKVVGLIDMNDEIARVQKRITQLGGLKDNLAKKMTMKGYEQKVPAEVRQENVKKMTGYETEVKECEKSIEDLKKFL